MRILVLPGDGIGPEITGATAAVPARADALWQLGLALEHRVAGCETLRRHEALDRPCGAVRGAVDRVPAELAGRIPDPGGPLGTRAFGQAVAAALG